MKGSRICLTTPGAEKLDELRRLPPLPRYDADAV